MDIMAAASVRGLASVDTYASMAWVNASIPVEAVRAGGIPFISSGSLMAICGVTLQSTMAIFTLREVSVIIQNLVISDAVPAVVLTAIRGTMGLEDLSTPSKSAIFPPLAATRPIPFAQSWEEPPPREMMESHWFSW